MSFSPSVLEAPLFRGDLIVERSADDAEPLRDLAAFSCIEQEQLEPGPCVGRISAFRTRRVQIAIAHRSCSVRLRGPVPAQVLVFCVVLPSPRLTYLRCGRLAPREIAVVLPGEELMLQTMGDSRVVSVTVDEDTVDDYALASWGQPLAARCRDGRLSLSEATTAGEIGESLADLIQTTLRHPRRLDDQNFCREREQLILATLLANVDIPRPQAIRSERREFAIRAKEYLRLHANEPLRMSELCGVMGRSSRTLEIGFREAFGMSLKARLQAMRLNGAHRDLCAAKGTDRTVKEIAMKWGFMHLGRFSVNYRKWFGRCPSHTLGR